MRIGRVSSREAERETRAIVSVKACGRHRDLAVPAGLREHREVVAAERAQVEARRARHELDVLLLGPQFERHAVAGQLADDLEQQPRREDRFAGAHHLRLRAARADRSPCRWRAPRRRSRRRRAELPRAPGSRCAWRRRARPSADLSSRAAVDVSIFICGKAFWRELEVVGAVWLSMTAGMPRVCGLEAHSPAPRQLAKSVSRSVVAPLLEGLRQACRQASRPPGRM